MRRAVVILNPCSGPGCDDRQIQSLATLARDVLAAEAVAVEVRPTSRSGDGHRLAREAVRAGCDVVVAWGGDGTVNEVASALVHTGIPLAIVPAGSGNGLAADLGLPFDPRAALVVAARGVTRTIDAGEVSGHLFFNIAGIGIDALVAARFADRGRRRRGPIAYLQLTSAELLRYRARRYTLAIDNEPADRDALLIAIANGRQYGNRLFIAPGAKLDDGLLEIVVVDELSLLGIARRLPALFRGTLRAGPGISMRAGRTLRVGAAGDIPFHVDGEPRIGRDELIVQTHAGALRVKVAERA